MSHSTPVERQEHLDISDSRELSDADDLPEWTTVLQNQRSQTVGPCRNFLRKLLQQAWGKHFDPDQGVVWDLALTLALPYRLCTEVLWPVFMWFWELHKILFNPDQTFRENWEELKALPREILELLKQVERRPEKLLTPDEAGWEEFLGPSLEPSFERFSYDTLKDHMGRRVVRVVELLPGKRLENIECRLGQVVLQPPRDLEIRNTFDIQETSSSSRDQIEDIHVSYEALSYCWGDDKGLRTPILCNGARLDITRNLKSALQHLRDEENIRVLWIDAICINQDDFVEREQQVSYMREIYQQAERAVVWLGESANNSDLALALCARVALIAALDEAAIKDLNYRAITSPYPKDYPWNSKEARKAAATFLNMAGEPTGQDEFLRLPGDGQHDASDDTIDKVVIFALQNLLRRPWFTRIWVTQEIGVAKEALLVCGKTSMNWSLFDLGYTLTLLTGEMKPSFNKDVFKNGMGRLTVLRKALAYNNELTPREKKLLTLPVLLNSFRKHEATDPRDKIFALFGLTSTDIEAVNLRPDYHSSVEDVYKNVARALMESSQDLYILSVPRSYTDLAHSLPSWVPDWSNTSRQPTMFSRYSEANDTMSTFPIPTYKASNGTRWPPRSTSEQGNTLHLSGYIIDRVAHLSEIYDLPTHDWLAQKFETYVGISPWDSLLSLLNFFSSYARSFDILYSWRTFALHPPLPLNLSSPSSPPKSSKSNLKEQYRLTLSADWSPNGPHISALDFAKWDAQFHAISLLRFFGLHKLFPGLYQAGALLCVALYWLIRGTDSAFSNTIECALLRRLAWTEGGRLGLMPGEARVGDMVVLVKGGDVPLVLRRALGVEEEFQGPGEKWILVGDCYVHGLMYGEAWDEGRCEGIDLV